MRCGLALMQLEWRNPQLCERVINPSLYSISYMDNFIFYQYINNLFYILIDFNSLNIHLYNLY